MNRLLEQYAQSAGVKALHAVSTNPKARNIFLTGLSASAVPMVFASLYRQEQTPILIISDDAESAGYMYHDLTQMLEDEKVFIFPSSYKRAIKYGQHDPANEILRVEVLSALSICNKYIIVTYPEAIAELVVSSENVEEVRIDIECGQNISIKDLTEQFHNLSFQRVDYVYEPGQYAVRGSIVDIYSFSSELPIRIDFFGDEIDSIRTFDVTDQLSKERYTKISILPQLSQNTTKLNTFTSFFPDDTILLMRSKDYIIDRVGKIYEEGFSSHIVEERMANATEVERDEIVEGLRSEFQLVTSSKLSSEFNRMRIVEYSQQKPQHDKYDTIIPFRFIPHPPFHKNFEILTETLQQYSNEGYKIYILSESSKQIERLKDIINEQNSAKRSSSNIIINSLQLTLHEGFIDNGLKICCFTDHQIFDRYHKYSLKSDKARHGKMALTLKELQEMTPGDFIVHIDFGVGKFAGLMRVPTGDTYQEVIRIIYQNNDKVDVSIHSLYKISKYRSSTAGEAPRLSHLGTGAWERLKEKTKKKIKDIARDLIKLYAKRRHEKGFQYSPDSYLQHELEASFMYEDTPDQLKATQDVKQDMESARPMDRLVCGDVGFGKTEVAMRAAFKAVCDSKQVAVLVPTTVLAFQHYNSFSRRMKDFPVKVEYLTRARTARQTTQILKDLSEGKIDILVGTHKLIGKNVKWHDLGLLIIDEEQKFGVSTKEKLRQLKTNVDTLTMSATPIPRTLQFSLMGARDMSIMRTPPPNRHPISTILGTYNHEIIADAINFELSRNGQIFFVNPRISNLIEIAHLIEKHVPDCRIAIGHGQMPPEELEKIIVSFMNHDYDLLLSTTIIENGIDVGNANTIIINDAHRFGLSDLHQMRGRVGRSNKKAFCYLLSPPLAYLTADARKRLEALETFSDLGSGFALAMQDLDLRGAGNLLGAEQSGFMEDLGYETYQKILKQAVVELRNEEFQDLQEEQLSDMQNVANGSSGAHVSENIEFVDDCTIESDLQMYFPDSYVPGSSERMLLYRELENIMTDKDLEAYKQRLIDRFGPVPHEGEELMGVILLRRIGKQYGCEKIVLKQSTMHIHLIKNLHSPYYKTVQFSKLIEYATRNPRQCQFRNVNDSPRITFANIKTVAQALSIFKEIEG